MVVCRLFDMLKIVVYNITSDHTIIKDEPILVLLEASVQILVV